MKHWRIITQYNGKPFLTDEMGREIMVEAERVVCKKGVASFFKEGSEIAFMLINMHGIATINCDVDIEMNKRILITIPPEPQQATKPGDK